MYILSVALEKPTAEEDSKHQEAEDNAQTIKANRSPGHNVTPLAKPPASEISAIVEDYSDLAADEDEQMLENKLADFKARLSAFSTPYHPVFEYLLYV